MRSDYESCKRLVIPEHILCCLDLTPQQKFIFILICSFCSERGRFDLPKLELHKMLRLSWKKFVEECKVLQFYDLVKIEVEGGREIIFLVL